MEGLLVQRRATFRKIGASFASILALISTLFIASPGVAQADSGAYCIITVERLTPGSPEATEIDRTCGPTREAAQAKRPNLKASVLLAHLFQHGFSGWRADLVADAACDSAGWGFSDIREHNSAVGGISSYRTFNECNGSAIYSETDFNNECGRFHFLWDVSVPWSCNDHVYSMRLYKSY
ncbi:hypothetical protein [Amycolatopsis albispora]|uniref:hypothetical protein n=1 Tax=Amycolatopsis albispora TaxID=1804986 RepID=UPI0013B3C28B|nr:hypothetical protein [Amycolatopsis albispora]